MTYDAFHPENNTPDWFGQWVASELTSSEFDVVSNVLGQLDEPANTVTLPAMTRHTMDLYYDTVVSQCPDFWPAVLRQLKPRPVALPFGRIAASVLALVAVGVGLTVVLQPVSNRQVAVLPVTSVKVAPFVSPVVTDPKVDGLKSDGLKSNAVRPAVVNTPQRVMPVKASRFWRKPASGKVNRSVAPVASETRTQRVEKAIIATATEAIRSGRAPGSLDYVFNVSSPAKDDMVLGLAAQ